MSSGNGGHQAAEADLTALPSGAVTQVTHPAGVSKSSPQDGSFVAKSCNSLQEFKQFYTAHNGEFHKQDADWATQNVKTY